MVAPGFIRELVGWRTPVLPNTADAESDASVAIAGEILHILEIDSVELRSAPGAELLRRSTKDFIKAQLVADPKRSYEVSILGNVYDFSQYSHLSSLRDLSLENATLASEIGFDYLLRPDLTVGIRATGEGGLDGLWLHAAIWCRWSIRSDRVQSLRREGAMLTRHRRGRQPHIMVVTTEPLPSRLASICRGTGEIDAVFHPMLEELRTATERVGSPSQKKTLEELLGERRLIDLNQLPSMLRL